MVATDRRRSNRSPSILGHCSFSVIYGVLLHKFCVKASLLAELTVVGDSGSIDTCFNHGQLGYHSLWRGLFPPCYIRCRVWIRSLHATFLNVELMYGYVAEIDLLYKESLWRSVAGSGYVDEGIDS